MSGRWWVAVVGLAMMAPILSGCMVLQPAQAGTVREITMWVEQMDWEIHPGVTTPVWAFCAEGDGVEPVWDGPCGVPGPTIHVTQGDTIRLTFRNSHSIPHTVHFHGWHQYAADFNGNPLLGEAMVAEPGETQVIEWEAQPAGSFIYHCHFETPTHMEMGMYGAFIVEEPGAKQDDRQDVVMVLDEWQVRDEPTFLGFIPDYNFFTINGRSFPLTQPIFADVGERIRIHMVNAGYTFHAMHVHGYTPDSWEGVAGPKHAVRTDVREIAPGQTVVLDFDADREGVWLMHDHVVPSVTAASDGSGFGAYPRGMLTVLAVGEAYQQALLDLAPDLVAAAGLDVADPKAGHAAHDHGDHDSGAGTPSSEGAAASSEADTGGAQVLVSDMRGYQFEKEVHVDAGTTITWNNADPAVHTVTATDLSFDSGDIAPGDSWSHTFTTPGTYEIYCKPHAYQASDGSWKGMVATVVVA